MSRNVSRAGAAKSSAVVAAVLILLSACGTTTVVGGDAGCVTYGEHRPLMPRAEPIGPKWGDWVADLDDGMTGTCR